MKVMFAGLVSLSLAAAGLAQAQARGRSPAGPGIAVQNSRLIAITRSGARTSRVGPAERFTGSVRVQPLFDARDSSRASGPSVSFERGARSGWHRHPRGQVLIVTSGVGRVQRWGAPIDEIREGDVVWIPPGVKHWHGAAPEAGLTHIAIQEHLDGAIVDWLEKVSDAQYGALAEPGADTMANNPKVGRHAYGDLAPALGEIPTTCCR